jgi:hypothetical protein
MERMAGLRTLSKGLAIILVAMLELALPSLAHTDEGVNKTLMGLIGVHVTVEMMRPDAERDGLLRSTLQTDVELRLRQAGIKVLSREERSIDIGFPILYLNVNTLKTGDGFYAYAISLRLRQAARLIRNSEIIALVDTWNATGVIAVVGKTKLSDVREDVKDKVDEFLNAYLAANPKR